MRFQKCLFALLAIGLQASTALAQFEKTPWSRKANENWSFKDTMGKVYSVETLRGKKVVVNFWATWCAPCKEELPTLQVFSDLQDPNKVTVTTINVKEPPSRAFRFMQNNQITLPLVSDPQGEIAQKFGVTVFPTTLLIDSTGQIKWRIVGEVDWTAAEAQAWLYSLR